MQVVDIFQRRNQLRKDASKEERSDQDTELFSHDEGSVTESDEEEGDALTVEDQSETDSSGGPNSGVEDRLSSVSFGALAKAQESLGKRKRPSEPTALLYQRKAPRLDGFPEAQERKEGKKDTRDFARSSKHAPAELSSKKAVSRRREVVPIHKVDIRDPRFEALSGPLVEAKLKNNYAFLDQYRDSEIAELKSAIRTAKEPEVKEKLKKALLSIESKKKTQLAKDKQQEIMRGHRKKEKELIEKGKKPFYLKKGEQKKLALVAKFEGMKGKQVDKVMERRRKKKAQKERRGMPEERRSIRP